VIDANDDVPPSILWIRLVMELPESGEFILGLALALLGGILAVRSAASELGCRSSDAGVEGGRWIFGKGGAGCCEAGGTVREFISVQNMRVGYTYGLRQG